MARQRTSKALRRVAVTLACVSVVGLVTIAAFAYWVVENDSRQPVCREVRDRWEEPLKATADDLREAGALRVNGPAAGESDCSVLQVMADFDESALPVSIGSMTFTAQDFAHDRRGCGRTSEGATLEAVVLGQEFTVIASGTTYELPCTEG